MPTLCIVPDGEIISKGDAVCVTSFDAANNRSIVKRATRDNLMTSKTVFGVAEDDSGAGNVFVLVAGEVAENAITSLGNIGGSRIVVTDISRVDLAEQCRLKRIDSATPTSEGFVVGTCDENGNLIIQPRHSSYETGFSKVQNVRAYGAVPDWNGATETGTDNLTAFNKTIQAAANEYQDSAYPVRIVADGRFYLSNTLHIPRGIILEGIGNGDPTHNPGTMLVFPANVTGIRIHSTIDLDIPPGLPVTSVGGALSQIRNLTVHCKQNRGIPPLRDDKAIPPYGFNGHGIHSSITCVIRDVSVTNFAENGIWIAAGSPEYPGNAAGTHLINTSSNNNGAHGFHFIGVDANVSLIEMCFADENWGNGFRDESVAGNTYVACYCQGNLGEPNGFSVDDLNHDFHVERNGANQSVFFGCYSEASIDHIYAPAGAIGGLLSQGTFAADSDGFSLSSGGIANIGPLITQYKFDLDGPRVEIGDNTENKRALSFIVRNDGVNVDFLWLLYKTTIRGPFHDWWEFQSNGVYRPVLRFPTTKSEARHPAPWMPNGLFIGRDDLANNPIHMTAAPLTTDPSPPSTQYNGVLAQTYELGDVIWNSEPSLGRPIGQVCIRSGTEDVLNNGTTTGSITSGTNELTVNASTGLSIGQYITISGISSVKKIVGIEDLKVTLDKEVDATVANAPVSFSSAIFSIFGELTNGSTSYSANQVLEPNDRYVTVTEIGVTITLPASPVDGQMHSIKCKVGVITTSVNTEGGVLKIDGQNSVTLNSGENNTFRYSAAIGVGEWEIR
jgi:hypothetical protein